VKITIAYFIPVFTEAALARWAENFVYYLDKEKYKMSFVGISIEDSFKQSVSKDIPVVSLEGIPLPGMFLKIAAYLSKEKPDIFISNAPQVGTMAMIAKVMVASKTKIFITEHNNFSLLAANIKKFHRRFIGKFVLPHLMRIFYPLADVIACVSKGAAQDLSHIIGNKKEIKVIYDPVTNDGIEQLAQEPVDHPWFASSEIPVIVAAGRLVIQKDYPTLLRAFKIICSQKNARLIIMGEGAERESLEKLSRDLKISKNVAFIGYQRNPYQYMKRASVFVLSSIHEGFGRVIVEAMACGAPVVSTNSKSGPDEIIEDGKSGLLVPVSDHQKLAAGILAVLNDPVLAQHLSQEGKKRSEYFSFQKAVREHEEVFEKIIEKK